MGPWRGRLLAPSTLDVITIDPLTEPAPPISLPSARAPFVTDYARWGRVLFNFPSAMSFQRMDDTFLGYRTKIDRTAKTIAFTVGPNQPTAIFKFDRPEPGRLVLDLSIDGHATHMEISLFDPNRFPLVSRGFNWIQERPFNH